MGLLGCKEPQLFRYLYQDQIVLSSFANTYNLLVETYYVVKALVQSHGAIYELPQWVYEDQNILLVPKNLVFWLKVRLGSHSYEVLELQLGPFGMAF